MCSTAVPAVDSLFCLWVVIFHEDNQTLGGHLFLNVYTNQLPAHPFVHPSTVSLLRVARDKCFGMDPIFFWSIPLKGKYFWILVVPGYQCTHYTAMFLAKALIILMPFSPAGCPWIRLSEHQQRLHPFTPRPPSFGMYSSEFENLCLLGNSGFQGCSWFHIFYWAVKATRHWYIGT